MKRSVGEGIVRQMGKYPLVSDQVSRAEIDIIIRELESVLTSNPDSNVVELGCYVGTVSLFLRRVMDFKKSCGQLHVYDSFDGLPAKTSKDNSPAGDQFRRGELTASKKQLISNFKKAGLHLPYIYKGWFSKLKPEDLPNRIVFAFLDGDFYESVFDSLKLVWPKLAKGATVIVDDYASSALPGAGLAVDEWLKTHRHESLSVEKTLAIIHV